MNKNIRFKTSVIRLNLSDYNDAYIVLKGIINIEKDDDAKTRNKKTNFPKKLLHLNYTCQKLITHL